MLAADDKELNQWASLRKLVQYREESEDNRDVRKYKKRTRDMTKKQIMFESSGAWKQAAVAEEFEQKQTDRRKTKELERKAAVIEMRTQKKAAKLEKKKAKKEAAAAEGTGDAATSSSAAGDTEEEGEKTKNHRERRKEARLLKEQGGTAAGNSEGIKDKREKKVCVTLFFCLLCCTPFRFASACTHARTVAGHH